MKKIIKILENRLSQLNENAIVCEIYIGFVKYLYEQYQQASDKQDIKVDLPRWVGKNIYDRLDLSDVKEAADSKSDKSVFCTNFWKHSKPTLEAITATIKEHTDTCYDETFCKLVEKWCVLFVCWTSQVISRWVIEWERVNFEVFSITTKMREDYLKDRGATYRRELLVL